MAVQEGRKSGKGREILLEAFGSAQTETGRFTAPLPAMGAAACPARLGPLPNETSGDAHVVADL